MTVYWCLFLHFYQPPWQDVDVLKKINEECYVPLLTMIERHGGSSIKITININGCLVNLLRENGMEDTIKKMKQLVLNGKIEVVGTAMYHPILPLIPKAEINHQVKMNEEVHSHAFGEFWGKQGFFPPEMAVSPELCQEIKDLGYEWMIMSGIANTSEWPKDYIEKQENGLLTFFRDDYLSNEIAFKRIEPPEFVKKITKLYPSNANSYIICALDAETFGHHIKYYETSFLSRVFSLIEEQKEVQVEFISNLKKYFPIKPGKPIRASSWSTDWSDITAKIPYPLWKNPFNPVHKIQYRLLQALYKLMEIIENHVAEGKQNPDFMRYYETARWFYDQALHSCWLWWASMRPMWSPNLIYKGVDLTIKTALNAQLGLVNLKIGEGDEYYQIIIDCIEKLLITLLEQEITFQKVRTIE